MEVCPWRSCSSLSFDEHTCSQIMFLRKTRGSRLNIFQPIGDLSLLSKSSSEGAAFAPGQKNDFAIAGGQIPGDEYSDHVVKVRVLHSGM